MGSGMALAFHVHRLTNKKTALVRSALRSGPGMVIRKFKPVRTDSSGRVGIESVVCGGLPARTERVRS
ncbi:MAG: hypothetical protein SCARUB_05056, partial [Candidatus Scalindua rubra]